MKTLIIAIALVLTFSADAGPLGIGRGIADAVSQLPFNQRDTSPKSNPNRSTAPRQSFRQGSRYRGRTPQPRTGLGGGRSGGFSQ